MEFRVARISSRELDESGGLFQGGYWAAFKERFGWRTHPLLLEFPDNALPLLALSRRLAPGLTLAYVPYGPSGGEPDIGREELLAGIARGIAPHLPSETAFVRFDLPWHREGQGTLPPPLACGPFLRRSSVEVQPASTVMLDLGPEEPAILAGMKPKTRYNIGLAGRRGVRVVEDEGSRFPEWYALYRKTSRRDRITVHSPVYYRTLFDLARIYGEGAPVLKLLLAEIGDEVVAGIIVAMYREEATYLYGASSDRHRAAMPNYALQWHAIRLARDSGCRTYDFFGIPPSPDPGHPMAGLYQFKTGFGGRILNRYGCYDALLRPAVYAAYSGLERLRAFYYKRVRKLR
jgi:lipid II:glycine glycyltransferase (peptidoglycan interpeptide bridge formation enzyme)